MYLFIYIHKICKAAKPILSPLKARGLVQRLGFSGSGCSLHQSERQAKYAEEPRAQLEASNHTRYIDILELSYEGLPSEFGVRTLAYSVSGFGVLGVYGFTGLGVLGFRGLGLRGVGFRV